MSWISMHRRLPHLGAVVALAVLPFAAAAASQDAKEKSREKKAQGAARPHQGHHPGSAKIEAVLVNPEKQGPQGAATVRVGVSGVRIVDPAAAGEKPHAGQAHVHYRVDGGPVIATTATKLSFHELAPGEHKIEVTLAGNDHQPLGPAETIEVKIPEGAGAAHGKKEEKPKKY